MKSRFTLLAIAAIAVAGLGAAPSAAAAPRALPGVPAADRNVTYAFPDRGSKPSVIIGFSPVSDAADYAVLCSLAENDEGKEWGAVDLNSEVLVENVPYGKRLSCILGARNPEGVTASESDWIIPILVDLPVPTKVTLMNDISPGGRFRVAWTEQNQIPRWVPRTTYVTLLPANSMRTIARTRVANRLARAATLNIPSDLPAGRYRICVTVENDVQGSGAFPRRSCAIRTVAPSYSGGGGGGSSSSSGSSGGSSGATGQTAPIGPVRV